jgi:hypothetical protein
MSMKKKSASTIPTATIVGKTITKKIIFGKIINWNKGTRGPTIVETDEKMREI